MENQMNQTLFDEWWDDLKECTNCESWWMSQCDGVPPDDERPCRAFKATRKVQIPEDIEALKTQMRALEKGLIRTQISVILATLGLIIHLITVIW